MITQYSYGSNVGASKNNNVRDIYKEWTAAEVRADLQESRTDLVLVCQNLTHDFNKASAIRAANCFLAKETYIVGRRKYNTVGAVGANHYDHVFHADDFQEVLDKLHDDGYNVYAVDNIMEYNPINIWDLDFPRKSAFVMGEENQGLDEAIIDMCDGMCYISQYGAIRSLNVAQAAACVMFEYSRRYNRYYN